MSGRKWTDEQRKAHSDRLKKSGKWNIKPGANRGGHVSEEQKRKQSEAMKGKPSPMKGKHHTEEAKEKNRQAHLGKMPWNKGKTGAQIPWNKGKKAPEESRRKMSESSKGCFHTEATAKKISMTMKIVRNDPTAKRQARKQALERISKSLETGVQIFPFYNKRACDYFRQFDEINQTRGRYATNGGEYFVKTLGYFLDYINHEKKLIIEWDEEQHYRGGKLKQHDVIRQREIEKQFRGYTFIRIREAVYIPAATELLTG